MKKNLIIDTSNELVLQPWQSGVRLIKPNSKEHYFALVNNQKQLYRVADLLGLPLGVFFRNINCTIQNINEIAVAACGFSSIAASINKTAYDVTPTDKNFAELVTRYDCDVIKNHKMLITEQSFIRPHDSKIIASICIRLPLYGSTNNIIGLLCFAFALTKASEFSVSDALTLFIKTGLLANQGNIKDPPQNLLGRRLPGAYLSRRETECLCLLLKGRTMKMIGKMMGLSPRTVEHYIESVKGKLGVRTKLELIDKAIDIHFL